MGILHFASASHTPTRSRATGHMHPGNASKWFREPSEKHLYQLATVKNPEDKSSAQNNVPPTAPYGAARRYCTLIPLGNLQHAATQASARSREMHLSGVAGHQVRNPSEKHLFQLATVTNPEDTSSAENNVPPTAVWEYCTLRQLRTLPHAPAPPATCTRAMHLSGFESLARNTCTNWLRLRTLKISLLRKITSLQLLHTVPHGDTAL